MASLLLLSEAMTPKTRQNRLLTSVPPWIFIGAAVVLLPIFTFMTVAMVNRQKANNVRLLLGKGAALIRSFEAGTRTGMMGMRGGSFRLQQLLTETAKQTDIVYLLVADLEGTISAHSHAGAIGAKHGTELDLAAVSRSKELQWRIVTGPDGQNIFEVYRLFSPIQGPGDRHMGRMMFQRRPFRPDLNLDQVDEVPPHIIFVGLDMSAVEAAQKADLWHAVLMGVILLLIGFAGVILLFMAQTYRATRVSLSRVQAFSDNLVENMPIGLVALDAAGRIAAINHVAAAVLRLSVDSSVGQSAREKLPAQLAELVASADSDGGVLEREVDCPVAPDVTIPLEAGASRLTDDSGQFYGHVLLFKDLSEVKTLRREIARSQRLATVGRLAAGVAHEIRNPLSSIKGFATYFKERYRQVPEDLRIADIMIQEVDRLNRVVGQLLEFARPVSVAVRPVPAGDFIKNSLRLVECQAGEKRIQIDTRFAPGIETIFVDPDRINQVLLNLYLNAIDAMGNAGGKLTVSVAADAAGRRAVIRVADNGVGISEADLAHIFDPYFTTKASGTGLGLAIAHKILEVHKGEISIDSQLGKGTTVSLFLPDDGEGR